MAMLVITKWVTDHLTNLSACDEFLDGRTPHPRKCGDAWWFTQKWSKNQQPCPVIAISCPPNDTGYSNDVAWYGNDMGHDIQVSHNSWPFYPFFPLWKGRFTVRLGHTYGQAVPPYRLWCVYAEGVDLAKLSPQQRSLWGMPRSCSLQLESRVAHNQTGMS